MNSTHVLGGLVGLILATAVLMAVQTIVNPRQITRVPRMAPWLVAAGITRVRPAGFVALSFGTGAVCGLAGVVLTGLPIIGLLAAVLGGLSPVLLTRHRARSARQRMREAWPDTVDSLVSGVRAGLSLQEAVSSLATSGPVVLRPVFSQTAVEYRATGSFAGALDVARDRAADPAADRVVAALRLAHEWGGTQVGDVLRTLSTMMREDARLRSEIRGRQSWTVSAARMAVAAPWITLLVLSTRSETAAAYATPGGAMLLAAAAAASVVAYAIMTRIAVLPDMPRLAS